MLHHPYLIVGGGMSADAAIHGIRSLPYAAVAVPVPTHVVTS